MSTAPTIYISSSPTDPRIGRNGHLDPGSFLPRTEAIVLVARLQAHGIDVRHLGMAYEHHMCAAGSPGKLCETHADGSSTWHGWGVLDPWRCKRLMDAVYTELECDDHAPLILDAETYRVPRLGWRATPAVREEAMNTLCDFGAFVAAKQRFVGLYGLPFGDLRDGPLTERRIQWLIDAASETLVVTSWVHICPDLYWPVEWSMDDWRSMSDAIMRAAERVLPGRVVPILWGRRPNGSMQETYELAPLAYHLARQHGVRQIILWDAAVHHDPQQNSAARVSRAETWVRQVDTAMRAGLDARRRDAPTAAGLIGTVPTRTWQGWDDTDKEVEVSRDGAH